MNKFPTGAPSQKVKNIPAYLEAKRIYDFSHSIYRNGKLYISFEGEFVLEEDLKRLVAEPNSLLQPFASPGENRLWRLNGNSPIILPINI